MWFYVYVYVIDEYRIISHDVPIPTRGNLDLAESGAFSTSPTRSDVHDVATRSDVHDAAASARGLRWLGHSAAIPRSRRPITTPDRPVSVWGGAYLAICPYLLSDLKCQAGRFERRAGRFECRIGWFKCKVGQFEYHNLLNVHIVCSVSTSRASSSAFAASAATRARSRRARCSRPLRAM